MGTYLGHNIVYFGWLGMQRTVHLCVLSDV